MADRNDLIASLAKEFSGKKDDELHLDVNNYISATGSLDCTASAIPVETLEKTLNVIKQHEAKFLKDAMKNNEAMQIVAHLRVAKKCVEEVISSNLQA